MTIPFLIFLDAVIGEAISDLILLPELERPSLVGELVFVLLLSLNNSTIVCLDNLHRTDPTTVVLSSTVQHHAPPNCDGQDPNQVPSNNEIVTLGQPVVGQ